MNKMLFFYLLLLLCFWESRYIVEKLYTNTTTRILNDVLCKLHHVFPFSSPHIVLTMYYACKNIQIDRGATGSFKGGVSRKVAITNKESILILYTSRHISWPVFMLFFCNRSSILGSWTPGYQGRGEAAPPSPLVAPLQIDTWISGLITRRLRRYAPRISNM